MIKFLEELNEEQYKAATTFYGPMLILAGAGSGKTKTIIARTANMIINDIDPESILVLTFTNKAAREMKDRGIALLEEIEYSGPMPTFSTFHSWGLKFIKGYISKHGEYEKIHDGFTIADENVQRKIIKDLLKDIFGKNTMIKEKNISSIFSVLQNNFIPYSSPKETYNAIENLIEKFAKEDRPFTVLEGNGIKTKRDMRKLSELFSTYKDTLRTNNMVDFEDLIILPVKILEEKEDVRNFIHRKYNFIMVDEFQDTNFSQIKLLNLILNKNQNICVVGDDSQSIYGWRGADIEYILNFHKTFDDVIKINLKKNYRSSKEIVNHANSLIENSMQKHEFKEALEAFVKDKGKIICTEVETEFDEAKLVASYIWRMIDKGVEPKDIAVLYRNNMIAHSLEKELIKRKIPYKIFKGRSLLQKKAVQEYLAFITLFLNPKNNVALETCLLSTAKFLSPMKLDQIKNKAEELNLDLSDMILKEKFKEIRLSKPQIAKLSAFAKNTIEMRKKVKESISIEEFLSEFYEKFPLIKEYERIIQKSSSIKTKDMAEKALDDIGTLNSIMLSYENLYEFMDGITLDEESEKEKDEENKVNLMTIHASKGLEFKFVFLVRFNQGVIPSFKSLAHPNLVEEERRLAYVAITRAKRFLHISYVKRLRRDIMTPSMFLFESGILKGKRKSRF